MSIRHFCAITLIAVTAAATAGAQSAAEEIAQGDKESAALNPQAALRHYEAALATDRKNVDLLCKAAHAAVDIGAFADSSRDPVGGYTDTVRLGIFQRAVDYAQRAVTLDSLNTDAQLALAQAAGELQDGEGLFQRLPYALQSHLAATTCLAFNPRSADCMHALGLWYVEVMVMDTTQPGAHMMLAALGAHHSQVLVRST